MSWPLSHEFNEAIQNPKVAFADPELRDGEPVVGATGLPLPRSGNFADVYQVRGAGGRDWAVKCFTRPVTGLGERYARVSDALEKANLPFNVGFKFLAEGIRVGGAWRPIVMMEWVEGLLLNQVVRDAAEKPATLAALGQMWVKLCRRLREAGIAHADLQHGNVLMVPGTRAGAYGLKLIDYDGVWVPALANTPSGESGHPSFQHPARAATRTYSPDVDRFPHLVVATALRGLSVAGPGLWERYDNGDNLLFTEDDYKKPAESKAMRELWQLENPAVQALVGRLALACTRPIPQTPWLDQLAPEGEPAPLDRATRHEAAAALGIALPVPIALPPEPVPAAEVNPFAVINEDEDEDEVDVELVTAPDRRGRPAPRRAQPKQTSRKKKAGGNGLVYAGIGAAAVLVLIGVVAAAVVSGRGKPKPKPDETVEQKEEPTPAVPAGTGPTDKGSGAGPGPKTKDVTPPPATWALKERWKQPLPNDWTHTYELRTSHDSRTGQVWCNNDKYLVFDPATGAALKSPDEQGIMYGVYPLDGGRVVRPWHTPAGPVRVWDARAGKEETTLKRPLEGGLRIWLAPNYRYLAVEFNNTEQRELRKGQTRLVDTSTDKVLLDCDSFFGTVRFTADSSRALIWDGLGKCQWVKLPSGEVDSTWNLADATEPLRMSALSGDGSRVVFTGTGPYGYRLIDGRTGQLVRRLPSFPSESSLSHDGKLIFARSADGSDAELAVADTGKVLTRVPLPPNTEPTSLGITPDVSAAFAAPPAGPGRFELIRYDITTGAAPASLTPAGPVVLKERFQTQLDFPASTVRFNTDGEAVLAHETNKSALAVVDARTGARRTVTAANWVRANNAVPMSGGRVGLRPTDSQLIAVTDVGTGKTTGTLPLPPFAQGTANVPTEIQISPDERFVAAGLSNPSRLNPDTKKVEYKPTAVRVIDARTNKTAVNFDWMNGMRGGRIAFSADSSRVLIVESTLRGQWFKLPAGEPDGEWTVPAEGSGTRLIALSRDGTVALCDGPVNGQTRAFVVDGRTGARGTTFPSLRLNSYGVALSADGTRAVLNVPARGAFVVVDTSTGAELARLDVSDEVRNTSAAVLSPDGRALAVFHRLKPGPLTVYDLSEAPAASPTAPPSAPGELRERWAATVDGVENPHVLLVADSAEQVFAGSSQSGFRAFGLKTGAPKSNLTPPNGTGQLFSLDGAKLSARSRSGSELHVLDAGTGNEVTRFPVPTLPTNVDKAVTLVRPSPDGKFLAVARGPYVGNGGTDFPVQVVDLATKKPVLVTTWQNTGSFHFTADSSRVLIAEPSGRCRWFKLPTGAADDEWTFDADTPEGREHRITSISADGSVLGYNGPAGLPKRSTGPATVDGKTGKVIHHFPKEFLYASAVNVSPDGTRAAVIKTLEVTSTIEVTDARTGAPVGRITLPVNRRMPTYTFTRDSSGLVVLNSTTRTVHVFDIAGVGGAAPAVPAASAAVVEVAPPGEPPTLKAKWDSKLGDARVFDRLLVTPNAVLLASEKGCVALEPSAGVPRAAFSTLNLSGATDLHLLNDGRIGTLAPKATEVKVWDGRSGGVVERIPVPELAPANAAPIRTFLSPDGGYIAATRSVPAALSHPAMPFKVSAVGAKNDWATDWTGGAAHFATNTKQVLLAEWSGRGRWFSLATGTAGNEWDLGPADRPHLITAASADGSVLGYSGPLAAKDGNGSAVLNGKTGKPIRVFHKDYQANSPVAVSADGARAALVREADRRTVSIDVVDLATGARIGRAKVQSPPVPGEPPIEPLFAFAPDGRTLAVYVPAHQRVHLFDLTPPKVP